MILSSIEAPFDFPSLSPQQLTRGTIRQRRFTTCFLKKRTIGQVCMLARQIGFPLLREVTAGMWN